MNKLIAAIIAALLLSGCSNGAGRSNQKLPERLGSMTLTKSITGQKALDELDRLHKELTYKPDNAAIGFYGQKAIIWLSFESSEKNAENLVARMPKKQVSKSGFSGFKKEKIKGVNVLSVQGMGWQHYYFSRGKAVVWLAADKGVARTALQNLLTYAEEVKW